jgi:ankyrin repeat protein
MVNEAEKETGRNALMFACYYGNTTSVELLAASDAVF